MVRSPHPERHPGPSCARPDGTRASASRFFQFAEGVEKIEESAPDEASGIVTNLTAFGAFVDVGVHQDGLVHLSQLADRFVTDPGRS